MAKNSPNQTPKANTGPKTETGRANSSRNATKHGMTARQLLVQGESQADLDLLLAQYHAKYPSSDPVLESLVTRAAEYDWFLQRNQRGYDATMQKLYKTDQQDWTEDDHAEYQRTHRYLTAAQRQLDRARQQILQDYRESRSTQRLEMAKNSIRTQTEKAAVPETSPLPVHPIAPSFQDVKIVIIDGKTQVWLEPPNKDILKILDSKLKVLHIERIIHFPDGVIPPEYAWLPTTDPSHPLTYIFQIQEFREHAAREPDRCIVPTHLDPVLSKP